MKLVGDSLYSPTKSVLVYIGTCQSTSRFNEDELYFRRYKVLNMQQLLQLHPTAQYCIDLDRRPGHQTVVGPDDPLIPGHSYVFIVPNGPFLAFPHQGPAPNQSTVPNRTVPSPPTWIDKLLSG
jgi:hypothetical protein